ncbi:type II toxin-antitoxin system VapC family toxin [Propionivibrio sp.]|uniref:type II toxin-antitoxin system VapC family toxin n=1 Tax=Propionivibrio sp. TaxID=2212460 RepID=UPI003BF1AB1C
MAKPLRLLLFAHKRGELVILQPVHWLAEVAAVLARISPITVQDDMTDLQSLQITVADTPAIWQIACALSVSLNHHLFDTPYHAVAPSTPETTLVTADRRYYEKAASKGAIVLLNPENSV